MSSSKNSVGAYASFYGRALQNTLSSTSLKAEMDPTVPVRPLQSSQSSPFLHVVKQANLELGPDRWGKLLDDKGKPLRKWLLESIIATADAGPTAWLDHENRMAELMRTASSKDSRPKSSHGLSRPKSSPCVDSRANFIRRCRVEQFLQRQQETAARDEAKRAQAMSVSIESSNTPNNIAFAGNRLGSDACSPSIVSSSARDSNVRGAASLLSEPVLLSSSDAVSFGETREERSPRDKSPAAESGCTAPEARADGCVCTVGAAPVRSSEGDWASCDGGADTALQKRPQRRIAPRDISYLQDCNRPRVRIPSPRMPDSHQLSVTSILHPLDEPNVHATVYTDADGRFHTKVFAASKPAGRHDALLLAAWLDNMLPQQNHQAAVDSPPRRPSPQRPQSTPNPTHTSSPSPADSQSRSRSPSPARVYDVAFHEAVRQVAVHCFERAEVLSRIWNGHTSLMQEQLDDTIRVLTTSHPPSTHPTEGGGARHVDGDKHGDHAVESREGAVTSRRTLARRCSADKDALLLADADTLNAMARQTETTLGRNQRELLEVAHHLQDICDAAPDDGADHTEAPATRQQSVSSADAATESSVATVATTVPWYFQGRGPSLRRTMVAMQRSDSMRRREGEAALEVAVEELERTRHSELDVDLADIATELNDSHLMARATATRLGYLVQARTAPRRNQAVQAADSATDSNAAGLVPTLPGLTLPTLTPLPSPSFRSPFSGYTPALSSASLRHALTVSVSPIPGDQEDPSAPDIGANPSPRTRRRARAGPTQHKFCQTDDALLANLLRARMRCNSAARNGRGSSASGVGASASSSPRSTALDAGRLGTWDRVSVGVNTDDMSGSRSGSGVDAEDIAPEEGRRSRGKRRHNTQRRLKAAFASDAKDTGTSRSGPGGRQGRGKKDKKGAAAEAFPRNRIAGVVRCRSAHHLKADSVALTVVDSSLEKDGERKLTKRIVPASLASILSPYPIGVSQRVQTRRVCMKLVALIYTEKIAADAVDDRDHRPRSDLPTFLFELFLTKYGLPGPAKQHLAELVNSVYFWRKSRARLHWFGQFIGLDDDPLDQDCLDYYLNSLATLQKCNVGPSLSDADDATAWVAMVRAAEVVQRRFVGCPPELREAIIDRIRRESLPEPILNTTKIDADRLLEILFEEWLLDQERSRARMRILFDLADTDRNGTLSLDEFKALLKMARANVGEREALVMFRELLEADSRGKAAAPESVSPEAFIRTVLKHSAFSLHTAEVWGRSVYKLTQQRWSEQEDQTRAMLAGVARYLPPPLEQSPTSPTSMTASLTAKQLEAQAVVESLASAAENLDTMLQDAELAEPEELFECFTEVMTLTQKARDMLMASALTASEGSPPPTKSLRRKSHKLRTITNSVKNLLAATSLGPSPAPATPASPAS